MIVYHYLTRRDFWRNSMLALLSLLCLNVAAISIWGGYDIRFGFVHLTAHELFKPILMMDGCFILTLMICGADNKYRNTAPDYMDESLSSTGLFAALLVALVVLLVLAIYYPSVNINFNHHDWTHRHISAEINSFKSALQLFKSRQADGFYRPLTFISLWLDYWLFGASYAGYHVQSIAMHIINALLAAWLAMALGFGRKCALWTGMLFAAAAVNFEPVVWPAARFDLLAAVFTLAALIFAIKYFKAARRWDWALPASLVCYLLGIMNKESSYCFPLLILFLLGTYSTWGIQRPTKAKVATYVSIMAVITALMIMVRIAVYGNLGGYGIGDAAGSLHFKVSVRTFTSLLRAVPIPFFGVNATPAAPEWMHIASILFAALILIAAIAGRGCFKRKEYALTACILLVLIPVLNIIGWIGTPMMHSRYLYMPAIFSMLLITSTFGKIQWPAVILGAFIVVNALGAISNIQVYRNMLAKTESLADSVRLDWGKQPDVRTICLVNLPESLNGVFFFGSEVVDRIGRKIPAATILRKETYDSKEPDASIRITYRWSDADQTLYLVAK
jgi:hypothetical protein